MTYNFERFGGYGEKLSRKISITKSSSFGIPPQLYQEEEIEQFTHALLFYERSQHVIGIQFVIGGDNGGFKLIKYGHNDKKGATFVARSFFNAYHLDPQKIKGKYEAKKEDVSGIGLLFMIGPIRDAEYGGDIE